jgi:hypothetical protein
MSAAQNGSAKTRDYPVGHRDEAWKGRRFLI